MTRTIEIIISPTGETRLETKGFEGTTCFDASRFVEEALGQRTTEQWTAEFYCPAREATHLPQIG